MPRGAIARKNIRLLTVLVPEEVIPLIDRGVKKEEVDRPQFVLRAVREKLERLGMNCSDD